MIILGFLQSLDESIQRLMGGLDSPVEGFARLALAAICGGLVGLEREVRGRQAGFRTYLLVCLGSALTMVVSVSFATRQWPSQNSPDVHVNIDPGRIAYGVMTGIGFLCAGVIVQQKGSVKGLTTAASMWCVASVGLAAGLGLYLISIFATVLVLVALWLLDYLEDVIPRQRYRILVIRVKWKPGCVGDTVKYLRKSGFHAADANFKRSEDLQSADIDLRVAFRSRKHYFALENMLAEEKRYELIAAREL